MEDNDNSNQITGLSGGGAPAKDLNLWEDSDDEVADKQ